MILINLQHLINLSKFLIWFILRLIYSLAERADCKRWIKMCNDDKLKQQRVQQWPQRVGFPRSRFIKHTHTRKNIK
jgi:predicted urease superfamily metal-dependent hydrolase